MMMLVIAKDLEQLPKEFYNSYTKMPVQIFKYCDCSYLDQFIILLNLLPRYHTAMVF